MSNIADNNEVSQTNDVKKRSVIPSFLRIDFSKPVTAGQQFAITCTMLLIACILFTVVYALQVWPHRAAETAKQDIPRPVVSEAESTVQEESRAPIHPAISPKTVSAEEILGDMTVDEQYYDSHYYGSLVLVNKDYSCRIDGDNTEAVSESANGKYALSDENIMLDKELTEALNKMFVDFEAACGETDITVSNGYISYEQQAQRFNEREESESAETEAAPGYSEHQTGYAFDLRTGNNIADDYDGQGLFSWINDNCCDYGIILRYPKGKEDVTGVSSEKWHFRYVGVPHAEYITANQLTLEEYIGMLKEHPKEKALQFEDSNGDSWCVYYVEADEIYMTQTPVPENYDYSISGDNCGGFIVTVKLS